MTDAVEKVPNCPAPNFPAEKNLTDDRQIDVASITLPRLPASLCTHCPVIRPNNRLDRALDS
jgi:hypothetical protein